MLRSFLPRSERAATPVAAGPGEDVVIANGGPGAEKVRSLSLLSADIQRRNIVGLVGLTLGWRRGTLDPAATSESALSMVRLSVNVHLTARGRKIDYARSFCLALGHEVGVPRATSLADRTVDAVAGIEGLHGFERETPRLAVTPASESRVDDAPPAAVSPVVERVDTPREEPARVEAPHVEAKPVDEPARVEATPSATAEPTRRDGPLPSGWYADPGGHAELRFWDGHRWTAHVSGDGRMWLSPLAPRDEPRL